MLPGTLGHFLNRGRKPCIEVQFIFQAIFKRKILPARPCRFINALFAVSAQARVSRNMPRALGLSTLHLLFFLISAKNHLHRFSRFDSLTLIAKISPPSSGTMARMNGISVILCAMRFSHTRSAIRTIASISSPREGRGFHLFPAIHFIPGTCPFECKATSSTILTA